MAGLPEAVAQPGFAAIGGHQRCEVVAGDQLGNLRPQQQRIKKANRSPPADPGQAYGAGVGTVSPDRAAPGCNAAKNAWTAPAPKAVSPSSIDEPAPTGRDHQPPTASAGRPAEAQRAAHNCRNLNALATRRAD